MCCGWGGRPRSSDARGIVRWNSFRSFGFSAPPAGSTLLGPPCPAMIRHCLPRSDWTTWIAGPRWEVRAPRPGDRLVPVGGVGHRPVRRLLMEARVPRSSRASYPVVARGETILWVPGICRSAADLPRPGTRAVRLHVTECDESQADGRA